AIGKICAGWLSYWCPSRETGRWGRWTWCSCIISPSSRIAPRIWAKWRNRMYDVSEITTKIRKLLALAAKAGTEAEAVAAAAKAQEMIERYNLTIGAEALEQEAAVERDGAGRSGRMSPHLSILGSAACRLFDCEFYYYGEAIDTQSWTVSYRRTLRFVGLEKNVEACVLTFNYFAASVESLLRGAQKTNPQWIRSELRAYRLGCSKRILSIASEVKEQRIQLGGEQVHALVRVGVD